MLGAYNSFKEALNATALTEELGTFIIQECNGGESAYTVRIATSVVDKVSTTQSLLFSVCFHVALLCSSVHLAPYTTTPAPAAIGGFFTYDNR